MSNAKKRSRAEARERAARMREEQRRTEKRRRAGLSAAAVLVVLTLAVVVGLAVQSTRDQAPAGTSTVPAHAVQQGTGFAVGDADAPVTVTAYEDFQCPACRAVEAATGPTLRRLTHEGSVRVVYKPMAILDDASTTAYSTRALNAAACVADRAGVAAYDRFHRILFTHQPPEGSAGLPDTALIRLADRAGATGHGIEDCIHSQDFEGWTQKVTTAASRAGVNATPTVLVDGQLLRTPTPSNLTRAVRAAEKS
ncbi:MAG: DsbA family protein [Actinomycetes bacterium]